MARKSSRPAPKAVDYHQTAEQKSEQLKAQIESIESEEKTTPTTPSPSKPSKATPKATLKTTAKKNNPYPVLEGDPDDDDIAVILGKKKASLFHRPNGGWKEDTVYKLEDYPTLSKVEFELCLQKKLDPLEGVALKKRDIPVDDLFLNHCVKNPAFHSDQFQLEAQLQEHDRGLSFDDMEGTDRVAKTNLNRLTALRCLQNRTPEEQKQLEYLEDQYKKSKQGDEDKEKEPITCYYGYWGGHYHLNKHYEKEGGINVYHDGSGLFCGLHIGLKSDFPAIKGIQTPEDFKIIKDIRFIDKKLCDGVLTMQSEKVRDFWMPILSGDGKHSLFATSLKMLDIPTNKSISIDGETAWAGIPKLEWFSPEIQALDPMDLLAILPEAEARTLMLHLGKMATGYSTLAEHTKMSPVKEIELKYTYRMLPIIFGSPKIGKSTLMEYIAYGIGKVGYSSDVLGQTFNQFAWNGVSKNLLYIDDMTPQSMKSMLTCSEIKTIASNGKLSTQKKNKDEVNLHAQCSLLMACNEIALPKYLDPGVVDRMYTLQTYTRTQMLAKSNKKGRNMLTREYWEGIARELNVDIEALTLYLVRRSLDSFLESIDVNKVDGVWVQGNNTSKIVDILEDYRSKFQYKLPVEMVNNLTVSARKSVILSQLLDENLVLPEAFDDSFSAFSILHLSKIVCKLSQLKKNLVEKDIPAFMESFENDADLMNDKIRERRQILNLGVDVLAGIEEWIGCGVQKHILQQYSTLWSSKLNSDPNKDLILGSKATLTFEGIWETMIATVTTKDGSKVEQERCKYASAFESARKDSEGYQIEFYDKLETIFAKYRGLVPDVVLNWEKLTESKSLSALNLRITTFEYDES